MFADTLELKLTLTIGGSNFKIPGGDVKALKIELHPYGFTCMVNFWVSSEQTDDKLFPVFTKPDLIKAQLEILPHYNPKKLTLEAIKLQGLVTQKAILSERTIEDVNLTGNPVLYRYYQVSLADSAYVLWRQHFPCDLMTDKSVKDLIEAHKGSVSLKYDWPDVLDKQFAINTLPLGIDRNRASFYDFALWFISSHNGVFAYDCNQDTYTISKSKKQDGEAAGMDKQDVENLRIEFPETIRHKSNLLNAYSKDPKREAIDQKHAVEGVWHDYLGRFRICADFEDRKALETQRLTVREHEVHLTFRNFPLIPYRPGNLVKFEGPGWSSELLAHGRVYRVRDLYIEAASVDEEVTADHHMLFARYNINMHSQLELKSESWVSLPPFKTPVFPMYVEGKIKSEVGTDSEKTYQIYQDAQTSLDQYRVIMPLFNNQEVIVLFKPDFFMGRFYFPAYKWARVLLALNFHSARIERFLDWGAGSRLPMDTQGDHILFGKTDQSQTSVNHVYVDEKPVLNIKRTQEKDTQMIKIEEGRMILETKEEE